MRPLTITFLFFLVLASHLQAQVTISGKITDSHSNSLPGVSIFLKDTYDGATSDSVGNYTFITTEKGKQTLSATAVGYKPFELQIEIADAPIAQNVQLKEEVSELKAVILNAGSFEASDTKKSAVLNSIDIATTAGANADVTSALKTLPGAQQVGESEGLFVRGGTAAETKTFIDGTLVNNFFFSSVPNIAQRGRFSPFIFKGTVFSTGGYSALYGQALSSALILESIDLPDQSSGNLGFSFLSLSGGCQRLAKDKKSSWGVNYAYTDLTLAFKIFKQRQDYSKIPRFHNVDANFRIKTSKTGMLKYYGYFSTNAMGFRTPSIDTVGFKDLFKLTNTYFYHNLSWKEKMKNKWSVQAGVSYSSNKDDIVGGLGDASGKEVTLQGLEFKDFKVNSTGRYLNSKLVFEKRLAGLSALRFGAESNFSKDELKYTAFNGQLFPETVKDNTTAAFAETDIYITNSLAAKVGSRLEHSTYVDKYNVAPRVSLAYRLGNSTQASLAYGIFYQNPERKYLPSPNSLEFSRATHYIAQVQKSTSLITLRLEAYYKKYDDLIKTAFVNTQQKAVSNKGYGYAKGFELFWRDKQTFENFDYWISYSYLDTKRDYLNFPSSMRPDYAARHTASLVMKKFVLPWKCGFNMSYTYASGRPYYYLAYNGTQYQVADRGITKDYHNASFSFNYLPNLGKQGAKQNSVFVISWSNVFGLDQTYGYQYSYDGSRKTAIKPTTNSFIFIGYFMTFGVDRTQDVINSNL